MISYRLSFIGLQVLLLVYTVQSFVLLTANIDDIQKLARKLLSEPLAAKLTGFVIKATQEMNQQMAESEADDKLKTSDIENYEHNIARQGNNKKNTQKYVSNNQNKYKSYYRPNDSKELLSNENGKDNENQWKELNKKIAERNEKQSKTTKYWRDIMYDMKHKETKTIPSKKKYSSAENNDIWQNDYFSQEEHLKHYGNQNGRNDNKEFERPKLYLYNREKENKFKESHNEFVENHRESSTSQAYYPDQEPRKTENSKTLNSAESLSSNNQLFFDLKKPPKSIKTKYYNKNYELKPVLNSNEFKELSNKFWKLNRFRSNDDTTTKKEKNDFDQYDNRNYPKADFIATSGSVKLPRMAIVKRNEDNVNNEETVNDEEEINDKDE